MSEQTDIRDILQEIADSPVIGTIHKRKLMICLKHFAAHNIPLEICADSRHLNRAVSTLKPYVREAGLRFPDYIPLALRSAEERKRVKT